MIALAPQVHSMWSRGYFGFQCKGIVPGASSTTITLQMHWMMCSKVQELNIKRAVDLENEHDFQSPDLFKIEMAHDDAIKMKQMIDFQWVMVCILALSGAAGSPELLGEPDPDQIHLMLTSSAKTIEPVSAIFDTKPTGEESGVPASPEEVQSQLPISTASQQRKSHLSRGLPIL